MLVEELAALEQEVHVGLREEVRLKEEAVEELLEVVAEESLMSLSSSNNKDA